VALRVASFLLIAAGVTALGWSGAIIVEGRLAQWQAWQAVESIAPEPPRSFVFPARSSRTKDNPGPPLRGAALAALSIPRIDLSAIVLYGSDARTLRRGPGYVDAPRSLEILATW